MFLLLQYILILLHHTDCLLNDYRFSYPHGLALIRSGLLVVTDSANNRVRLVDLEANSVSTLSDGITSPMSVAYNPETTSVYVGGADGLYLSNVPSKCWICQCQWLFPDGSSLRPTTGLLTQFNDWAMKKPTCRKRLTPLVPLNDRNTLGKISIVDLYSWKLPLGCLLPSVDISHTYIQFFTPLVFLEQCDTSQLLNNTFTVL